MQQQFGGRLVTQKGRIDWIGQLADSAARDPRFPQRADPDGVRAHLIARGADGDMFEMLDDAEREWRRGA
jgi:hypothetical protein